MTLVVDGFLYHPDGDNPNEQLQGLLLGQHNPAFDDLFAATKHESKVATQKAKAKYLRAKDQLVRLKARIADLEKNVLESEMHEEAVAEAAKEFDKTGEIAGILIPCCEAFLAAAERRFDEIDSPSKTSEIEAASQFVSESLESDENWNVQDAYADDKYVYVTVRKPRSEVPAECRPTKETVLSQILQAFDAHGRDFFCRTRPVQLASVFVGCPRAP